MRLEKEARAKSVPRRLEYVPSRVTVMAQELVSDNACVSHAMPPSLPDPTWMWSAGDHRVWTRAASLTPHGLLCTSVELVLDGSSISDPRWNAAKPFSFTIEPPLPNGIASLDPSSWSLWVPA